MATERLMTAVVSGELAVGQLITIPAGSRGNKDIIRVVSVEKLKITGGGGSEHYASFWNLSGSLGPAPIFSSISDGGLPGSYPAVPTVVAHEVTRATTIKNLRGRIFGPPGVGNTLTITLVLNGVPTLLAIVFAGAVAAASDLVDSVPVVPGDLIEWRYDYAGGPPEVDFARLTWEET